MGCYKSPDGQGQLGDPKGEACQLPGSVWFRTQIPSIKLESKSSLFFVQVHLSIGLSSESVLLSDSCA